jgi:hypothetical protein
VRPGMACTRSGRKADRSTNSAGFSAWDMWVYFVHIIRSSRDTYVWLVILFWVNLLAITMAQSQTRLEVIR